MKILIFGTAGMIGHRVWMEANQNPQHSTYGIIRKSITHYSKFNIFNENIFDNVDVSNWESVEQILNQVKPDCIINALGITIRKKEIEDIQKALEINSFFPRRLLKWAQANNSRVIHLSTDCVFDGSSGQYLEISQPSAQDHYGKTKFLGEIEGDRALTLRFSCIGRELESHTELLDWFLSQAGKKIKGYRRAIYSGVTTHVVAREVIRMVENFPNLNGVFQLSSSPISKYDLLHLIQETYKIQVEIEPFDGYLADKSLVCEKFKNATGFIPMTWEEMIKELYQDKKINY